MKSVHAIVAAMMLSVSIDGALVHADAGHSKKSCQQKDGHASALGKPGDAKSVTRTVEVGMNDTMRFSPDKIAATRGETIRFVVKNNGKVKHEMVLGTAKELKEHAALMRKFPEMEHADPNQVSVEPGKTGELVWRFTQDGTFDFACLQPGHFEAGMVGKVSVAKADGAKQPAKASAYADDVHHKKPETASTADAALTSGEVRKVDKDAGKVTIKHAPLKNLGMPAMTMVFRVKDPQMLDQMKEGDKINFAAEKMNGALTVVKVEPAR